MVEEGRALLRADGGEQIDIDLRVGPEFEDFLDDAFVRAFDGSGREVAHAYIYDGTCSFTAPHEGVYRLLFTIWARGSGAFEGTSVISPVVLRPSGPHEIKVHRDPVDGFRNGPDSLDSVSLVAGERRRFFLRADDLPDTRHLRGNLSVLAAEDGPLLARVPVRADTRPLLPPSAEEELSQSVESTVARALLLAGRPDLSARSVTPRSMSSSFVEQLRAASPESPGEGGEGEEGRGRIGRGAAERDLGDPGSAREAASDCA